MSKAIVLTDKDFSAEILEREGVALIDFWAEWCGPCRMMGPVVDELVSDYEGKARVYKLDVDAYGALAAQYGVMNIPTLLLFKNGKEQQRLVGLQPKAALAAALDKALSD